MKDMAMNAAMNAAPIMHQTVTAMPISPHSAGLGKSYFLPLPLAALKADRRISVSRGSAIQVLSILR